ncbi:MAG: hypothetical protein M3020_15655, partial [Myxococcota bacterium]|nr:hypothetical protein [Myxococcota bacterium]
VGAAAAYGVREGLSRAGLGLSSQAILAALAGLAAFVGAAFMLRSPELRIITGPLARRFGRGRGREPRR